MHATLTTCAEFTTLGMPMGSRFALAQFKSITHEMVAKIDSNRA